MQEITKTIIFVEGLPGTGKTSISKWIHEETGFELITEFSNDSPNDMYEVAGMSISTYEELCIKYPMLKEYAEVYEGYIYINIGSVKNKYSHNKGLINSLLQWDIGDECNQNMDIQFYISCSLTYIKKRFNRIKIPGKGIVMDSVWLQNPINELLLRSVDDSQVISYCVSIINILSEFNTLCLYMKRSSVADSLNYAALVKGDHWRDRVLNFISTTPYGIINKLEGYEGLISYFTKRAEVEEDIFSKDIITHYKYSIDCNNWDTIKKDIRKDVLESYCR